MPRPLPALLRFALATFLAAVLPAAEPTPRPTDQEAPIALSPFTVVTEKDTGYHAIDSLAGGREADFAARTERYARTDGANPDMRQAANLTLSRHHFSDGPRQDLIRPVSGQNGYNFDWVRTQVACRSRSCAISRAPPSAPTSTTAST